MRLRFATTVGPLGPPQGSTPVGDHCGRECVGRGVAAEIRAGGAAGDGISDAAIEQAGGLANSP